MPKSKIAIIGAGWWGVEVYVPALLENPIVDLVAINRRNQRALDEIITKFEISYGLPYMVIKRGRVSSAEYVLT